MTAGDIKSYLARMGNYHSICVPEFTYGNYRIDMLMVDLHHRLIRGFEIKTDRGDWLRDDKWIFYTKFCSSVSIVCPEGLIQKGEVDKPFGLLWVKESGGSRWIQRPKNIQKRNSISWLWTYLSILEFEFPRMYYEMIRMENEIERLSGQKGVKSDPVVML